MMSAGTIILAFAVTVFKIPHGFMTGGVTGYAMFVQHFFPFLKTSTWVAILNIALIIKKYTSIDTGKALFCSDMLVACSAFALFGVEIGLLSLADLFIKAFFVDSVIDSINCSKYFLVITDKPDIINELRLQSLRRL